MDQLNSTNDTTKNLIINEQANLLNNTYTERITESEGANFISMRPSPESAQLIRRKFLGEAALTKRGVNKTKFRISK